MTTPGTPITPGSTVTPVESVRPVHTGQKSQLEKANQCLAQSELPVLISPDRSVQLEPNVHEPLGNMPTCRLNICKSILKSFKTKRTLTVRMSGQTSLPNELICDILDIRLRASVTPATHRASVTLVTVQTMRIQSPDLGQLGLMLLSTGQTKPDIALMSLVLHGEIVTHIEKLFPSNTLTQVNTLQLR